MYLILVVIIFTTGFLGYIDYTVYTEKQMQTYMIQAMKHNNTALSLNTTYSNYVKNSDYDNAIKTINTMVIEYQLAIDNDNNAMKHASGVYKDYLTYDIMRLNNNIKLANTQLQALNYAKNNDLSGVLSLVDSIKQLSEKALDYRNKEDEILTANPDKFKFLNS